MATAPVISAGILEPLDELIAKLVGGNDDALVALLKHEETLTAFSRYRDLDHSEILGAILDYQRKFHSLPSWADRSDYIGGQTQNAGLLVALEDAKSLAGEEYAPIYSSYNVLIDELDERVKAMKFE